MASLRRKICAGNSDYRCRAMLHRRRREVCTRHRMPAFGARANRGSHYRITASEGRSTSARIAVRPPPMMTTRLVVTAHARTRSYARTRSHARTRSYARGRWCYRAEHGGSAELGTVVRELVRVQQARHALALRITATARSAVFPLTMPNDVRAAACLRRAIDLR